MSEAVAAAQEDPAEVASHNRRRVPGVGGAQGLQHRRARRARRLAVVGRMLQGSGVLWVNEVGRAVVTRLRVICLDLVNEGASRLGRIRPG